MNKNTASWDRIVRVIGGVFLIWLGFASIGGAGGAILGIVGLVFLVTGAVGWCPIYRLFKTGTAKLTGADVG